MSRRKGDIQDVLILSGPRNIPRGIILVPGNISEEAFAKAVGRMRDDLNTQLKKDNVRVTIEPQKSVTISTNEPYTIRYLRVLGGRTRNVWQKLGDAAAVRDLLKSLEKEKTQFKRPVAPKEKIHAPPAPLPKNQEHDSHDGPTMIAKTRMRLLARRPITRPARNALTHRRRR